MQRIVDFVTIVAVVVWLLGWTAAPVVAAESTGPEIFTPVRLDLAIYTIIVFLLLLFILTRFAWKPMLQGLQKREETIRSALADAQRANEEAKRLRDQLQAEVARSNERAAQIVDEARRDAQRLKDDLVTEGRAAIQSEQERARREIERARDQALQDLWNQTAQIATVISSKTIRRQLSVDDHRRLVDEALAELHQAGKNRQSQVASIQA